MKKPPKPHADSAAAIFLRQRISDLRHSKNQALIAAEAGFTHPNVLSMMKSGTAKIPLDRVPALAKALECDAAYLFRLALRQLAEPTTALALEQIFRAVISENEREWVHALREVSEDRDPSLTAGRLRDLRAIFHK